ncbi:cytochrome c-type biogenesis protein CcmH [Pseudothauera rhizosphaerae]|uniref:Cytochrome c-type biogenesis protein n=2 Tax=Pseudothauera rhizosphaerae TaxID=2565932 RepID=A0A4S4ALL1_9RHOO|nr:cytochrome c-type biogenesis protein [Pseudothauera rhizosphaerae]THF60404.1 cytochrome c-type biogenesis protein CcmH [Pseudothauera rhizosphaerae]
MLRAGVLALTCLAGAALAADEAVPIGEDPALEARVLDLSHKLRCLVCQNQSVAESNAPLALDMRSQVREQLAAGKSEQEVVDFLVARFGDFVVFKPPFRASTLLLWLGPGVLLVVGLGGLAWRLRRRMAEAPPAPLDEAERARARALLAEPPATHSPEEPRS